LFVGDTLDEVILLSDKIVVMRDGQVSETYLDVARETPSEKSLVKAMV